MYSIAIELHACDQENVPQSYFLKALPLLRDALVTYINERPPHYLGLCSWVTKRARMMDLTDWYVIIDIMRRQDDLISAFGVSSYVDDEDGPTEVRVEFARLMLILILDRLASLRS